MDLVVIKQIDNIIFWLNDALKSLTGKSFENISEKDVDLEPHIGKRKKLNGCWKLLPNASILSSK